MLRAEVFNALNSLGYPVHPIAYGKKTPLFDGWADRHVTYRLDVVDNDYHISQYPSNTSKIVQNFNIGMRAGASVGNVENNYICYVDIDLKDTIDKDAGGRIIDRDIASRVIEEITDAEGTINSLTSAFAGGLRERSGGQHRGFHGVFVSPLPVPSKLTLFTKTDYKYIDGIDLYALNEKWQPKNIIIAPSHGIYPYTLQRNKEIAKTVEQFVDFYRTVPRIPMEKWARLILPCISESETNRDPLYIQKLIFKLLNMPIVNSDNINYQLFGSIYPGLFKRTDIGYEQYLKFMEAAISSIARPDMGTVQNITKYAKSTYERADIDKTPGFPRLKEHISTIWATNRGLTVGSPQATDEIDDFCELLQNTLNICRKRDRSPINIDSELLKPKPNRSYDPTAYLEEKHRFLFNRMTKIVDVAEEEVDTLINIGKNKNRILHTPRKPEIIDGLISPGHILLFGAPSASGKSVVSIDIAYRVCTGGDVFNRFPVRSPKKVMYIYFDKDTDDFIIKYLQNYKNKDLLDNPTFYFFSSDDFRKPGLVTCLAEPENKSKLFAIAKSIKPDIIIFDTLAACFPNVNKNSTEANNGLYEIFLQLNKISGGAIMALAHTPKGGKGNYVSDAYFAVKGDGTLVDRATTVMYMEPLKDDRGKIIAGTGIIKSPKSIQNREFVKYSIVNNEDYDHINNVSDRSYHIEYEIIEDDSIDYGAKALDSPYYKTKIKILRNLYEKDMKSSDIRTLMSVPRDLARATLTNHLSKMMDEKLIVKKGQTNRTIYRITNIGKILIEETIKSNGKNTLFEAEEHTPFDKPVSVQQFELMVQGAVDD